MRLADYVGASLTLLFTAGKLLACPLPSANIPACAEPLDIVEEGYGFSIVQRQPQALIVTDPKPTAPPRQIGSTVKLDATIRGHALTRPIPIAQPEAYR